jgi:hypothetical protein
VKAHHPSPLRFVRHLKYLIVNGYCFFISEQPFGQVVRQSAYYIFDRKWLLSCHSILSDFYPAKIYRAEIIT